MISQNDDIAEWTVMIYMNGCNNLEDKALDDFMEMSKVGSNKDLNIIVQLSRCKKSSPNRYGDWEGTKRFKVTKNMEPTEGSSRKRVWANDMTKISSLKSFIRFSKKKEFKAKRYMLVIWDHGNFWKYSKNRDKSGIAKDSIINFYYKMYLNSIQTNDSLSGFLNQKKIVLLEEFEKDIVETDVEYPLILSKKNNKDRVMSLNDFFEYSPSKNIDIIGFDTCLTSNIETAYVSSNKADIMIASQDYVDGEGWNYTEILKAIQSHPKISPEQLSQEIMNSYKKTYADSLNRTISSIDLSELNTTINAINAICEKVIELSDNGERSLIYDCLVETRKKCLTYESKKVEGGVSIDLISFMNLFSKAIENDEIQQLNTVLNTSYNNLILNKFRSQNQRYIFESSPIIGSNGLSIYLPSHLEFSFDYTAKDFPFSKRSKWDNLFSNFQKMLIKLNNN